MQRVRKTSFVVLVVLVSLLIFAFSNQAFAQAGTWLTKTRMQFRRYYPGAAVLNDKFYVAGGCYVGACGGDVTASVEALMASSLLPCGSDTSHVNPPPVVRAALP